jgi:hypothetical protein
MRLDIKVKLNVELSATTAERLAIDTGTDIKVNVDVEITLGMTRVLLRLLHVVAHDGLFV